jgi:DNA-binding transcriptional ArsR family regulator
LSELSPAELTRLLGDGDRLRVVAALVLGASTVAELCTATGLDSRRAGAALARVADGGLVESDGKGWRLREEVLREAARAAADEEPAPEAHEGVPAEDAKVLRAFVRDRRLKSIPATASKRRVILNVIAQDFEPGVRYSERQVNLMLGQWHPDFASLRRYLIDEDFLERSRNVYWRAGGSFDV